MTRQGIGLTRRMSVWVAATVAAIVMLVTGCSVLGSKAADPPPTGPLEKSTLHISGLKLVDTIPVHLAIANGYFKDEGLAVEYTVRANGKANIDSLMNGETDFGLTSYPNVMTAQAKRTFEFVVPADAVQTTPDLILAVTKKDSPIRDPKMLAGKTVAVSSKRGVSELAMTDQLNTLGIPPNGVSYLQMSITDMPAALERGDIAAAVIAQPDLEQAKKQGATKLLDPFSGATASFPWSGWIATGKFAKDNPKTLAAFQKAYKRGVAAARNRDALNDSAVKNLGITPMDAENMTIPDFPETTDPTRLQRVADLLALYKEIDAKPGPPGHAVLDVRSMMWPPVEWSSPVPVPTG